ncbi:MAG: serine/threonine-protein kinase [Planctomycetota bacterium]
MSDRGEGEASNTLSTESQLPNNIGRFQIVGLIGHGGMGSVYLANDVELDRKVAIKIPRYPSGLTEEEERRLVSEAQIAGRLDHPHLIDVFEIGRWENRFFMVLRYADGGDLRKWLEKQNERLAIDVIVNLLCSITSAVAHCHQNGIVHFDLKPANILFSSKGPQSNDHFPGTAMVADFGLAKICERNDLVTATSSVFGTLQYMAPEQIEGRRQLLGFQTDVFSLGVILFELLAGEHPFAASSALEMVDRIRLGRSNNALDKLRVPTHLKEICRTCLATNVEDRYPTAVELHRDLIDFRDGKPISTHRYSKMKRFRRWMELEPRIPQAAVACLIGNLAILLGFLGAMLLKLMPDNPIPGDTRDFVIDAMKLILFPHAPMMLMSFRVLQGHPKWQWGNIMLCIVMIALVVISMVTRRSPIEAYNGEPFTFWMIHIVIFAIGFSMLLMQLLSLPAMIRRRR